MSVNRFNITMTVLLDVDNLEINIYIVTIKYLHYLCYLNWRNLYTFQKILIFISIINFVKMP